MSVLEAPNDFRIPISRVRSRMLVYIERKIAKKPTATANAIIESTKVLSMGKGELTIMDKYSFMRRSLWRGKSWRIASSTPATFLGLSVRM